MCESEWIKNYVDKNVVNQKCQTIEQKKNKNKS